MSALLARLRAWHHHLGRLIFADPTDKENPR